MLRVTFVTSFEENRPDGVTTSLTRRDSCLYSMMINSYRNKDGMGFIVKLNAKKHLDKTKRSMTNMRGGQGDVKVMKIIDMRVLYPTIGDVALLAATKDGSGQMRHPEAAEIIF